MKNFYKAQSEKLGKRYWADEFIAEAVRDQDEILARGERFQMADYLKHRGIYE